MDVITHPCLNICCTVSAEAAWFSELYDPEYGFKLVAMGRLIGGFMFLTRIYDLI